MKISLVPRPFRKIGTRLDEGVYACVYLVEREEVGGKCLKEESLITEPHLLTKVHVSVVEVLAKCVHDLLKVGLHECSQVLKTHARGQDATLSLHQTPVATAILWTGARRKTISWKVTPA